MITGKVYLVGAGPGDPGLLTVRGLELLRNAPVIVYDQLVNPALLNEAGSQTIKVFVGKRLHRARRNQQRAYGSRARRS